MNSEKHASGRMNRAALYNLVSGAFCVATGMATGSSVATTEGIESILGDSIFHSANAREKRGVAIGAIVLGAAMLVATEARELMQPVQSDSYLGSVAIASSLGANVASYNGLLPHNHEHSEGDNLYEHEKASKMHAFGDMAGSVVALFASGLAMKYGIADRIGVPVQVGVRLGFYKMERDILNGRSKRLGTWIMRTFLDK